MTISGQGAAVRGLRCSWRSQPIPDARAAGGLCERQVRQNGLAVTQARRRLFDTASAKRRRAPAPRCFAQDQSAAGRHVRNRGRAGDWGYGRPGATNEARHGRGAVTGPSPARGTRTFPYRERAGQTTEATVRLGILMLVSTAAATLAALAAIAPGRPTGRPLRSYAGGTFCHIRECASPREPGESVRLAWASAALSPGAAFELIAARRS
jgi:hypothetical protein